MREAILSNSGTAEFAIAERCWTKCYRVDQIRRSTRKLADGTLWEVSVSRGVRAREQREGRGEAAVGRRARLEERTGC
jgi:hypothetical protein